MQLRALPLIGVVFGCAALLHAVTGMCGTYKDEECHFSEKARAIMTAYLKSKCIIDAISLKMGPLSTSKQAEESEGRWGGRNVIRKQIHNLCTGPNHWYFANFFVQRYGATPEEEEPSLAVSKSNIIQYCRLKIPPRKTYKLDGKDVIVTYADIVDVEETMLGWFCGKLEIWGVTPAKEVSDPEDGKAVSFEDLKQIYDQFQAFVDSTAGFIRGSAKAVYHYLTKKNK